MKKLTLYTALLGSLLLGTTSCSDYLDINESPNVATEVAPDKLFTFAVARLGSNRTVENSLATEMVVQHFASGGRAGVFSNPERYQFSVYTEGNSWSAYYSACLKNYQLAIESAEASEPMRNNVAAQAKLMKAHAFFDLTVLFEEIPFTEAVLYQEFASPKFDSQETVLKGIVDIIDDALGQFDVDSELGGVTDGDLMYKGDLDLWIKFGNSLKLRTLMLIAGKDASYQAKVAETIANGNFLSDYTEDALIPFDAENKANANYIWKVIDQYGGGENIYFYAGETTVELMKSYNDPRLTTYFDDNGSGEIVGQTAGVFSTSGISPVSLTVLGQGAPDRLLTSSETSLYIAEAYARGWAGSVDLNEATDYLRAAVADGMRFYEFDEADIEAYISSLDLVGMTQTEAIETINDFQYIDLFNRGVEAWTQWRRTKVPNLPVARDAVLSDVARRYSYPAAELSSNANAPEGSKAGDAPMWFETK